MDAVDAYAYNATVIIGDLQPGGCADASGKVAIGDALVGISVIEQQTVAAKGAAHKSETTWVTSMASCHTWTFDEVMRALQQESIPPSARRNEITLRLGRIS